EIFSDDVGLGPYGSELGFGIYMLDRFLLDTGANSILAAKAPTLDITSNGYRTEGDYYEQGVAGYTEFDVSAPYRFDFYGTDDVRQTLPQTEDDVRILSNRYIELGGPIYAGGIAGIVGMPAMVDRVTSLDLTAMVAWSDIFDEEATGEMGVTFAQGENALPQSNGHRYSVPVDTRVFFEAADGLPPGSPEDAPVPVWADIPFLTATPGYRGNRQSGGFLLDTGAQLSMLSTDLAMAIGLDEDGDGNFDNEMLGTIEVGGIGGSREVPILLIDQLSLATEQGVDLTWTGTHPDEIGLEVIILDIAEGIDGILGADLLTAGASLDIDMNTFEFIFGGAPYFDQIHFDFREMRDGSGMIYFDLHPYRAEISESDLSTRVGEGGDGDTYDVVLRSEPTADVIVALDTPVPTPADENAEIPDVQLTAVDAANPANTFLTFTPLNWDVPQTVRVEAIDDTLPEGPHTGWVTHRAISTDTNYDGIRIGAVIAQVADDDTATVAARHIFYNNSIWDHLEQAANSDDDAAIATDKEALLPGRVATIANYTSYDKGINGIMIDVDRLADADSLSAQTDFLFKVGNDDDPSTWPDAPMPRSISVREGNGVGGSDRVTILWDDHAIESRWLQVTVLATDETGLFEPDVFYFGNAVAEAGDQSLNAIVNATDEIAARNFPHGLFDRAGIEDRYDYNRDRLVNGSDWILARGNQTNPLTMLRLIHAPAHDAVFKQAGELKATPSAADVAWLYEYEQVTSSKRVPQIAPTAKEIDLLLTIAWP
ncbi:MAG: retropepsin-like aspartic protease, partial [Thermoguttaceae bacterium]